MPAGLGDERGGVRTELRNDPLDPKFVAFQRSVHLALDYGLTSEPVPTKGKAKGGGDSGGKQGAPAPQRWQLCFDRSRMKPGVATNTRFAPHAHVSRSSHARIPDRLRHPRRAFRRRP